MGINRWEEGRAYYKDIVSKINLDISNGLTYQEILKKHKLTSNDLIYLYRQGLSPISSFFRKKRNKLIVAEFAKGKTAEEIIKIKNKSLNSPQKLNNINSIYRVVTLAGAKRYPQIGSRRSGKVFENIEVLNFIRLYRDEHKYTFKKITNILNKKKQKTLTGKTFSENNVIAKYNAAKKLIK